MAVLFLYFMGHRQSIRKFSKLGLEHWFERILGGWEKVFTPAALQAGQRIYRSGCVREMEVAEDNMVVRCDPPDAYCVIEWDRGRPVWRASIGNNVEGEAIAVAGLYELEELIADSLNPLPESPRPKVEEEAIPAEEAISPITETQDKPEVRVKFFVFGSHLCFRAVLRSASGAERVVGFDGEKTLPAGMREALIRLTMMARRSGFHYVSNRHHFAMVETERFFPFLRSGLAEWAKGFVVECSPEVDLLTRGVRQVEVRARVTRGSTPGKISWRWEAGWNGDILSRRETEALFRRRDKPVLLSEKGLVQLGPDSLRAIDSAGQAGYAVETVDTERYMLYSLTSRPSIGVDVDEETEAWRRSLEAGPRLADAPSFLRPYQRNGVEWLRHLCQHECHPLLADEMGLGKTVQVLALLSVLPADAPSLVVCPASVIPVWQKEARRFFQGIDVRVLQAGQNWHVSPGSCLWLASYTQLRRHRPLLAEQCFHIAVLDEAQHIKNPDAKVTRACLGIRARHRLALTGTPLENSEVDVWSIFRFLMPGLLGGRAAFVHESAEGSLAARVGVQIAPFMLRRTKRQVATELPEKVESEILCPLTERQRAIYGSIAAEVLRKDGSFASRRSRGGNLSFLAVLTRLRQACCDLRLLPRSFLESVAGDNLDELGVGGKILALREKLQEILPLGRKVVVFSQFVSFLEIVRTDIEENFPGVGVLRLTGKTRDRAAPVEDFQRRKGAAVILTSLKAGGTGITLHAADYVFILDPWWNPASERQAIDRVHRLGQDKTVFVYRMVAPHTLEESIQRLQEHKGRLFDDLVERADGGFALLRQFGSLNEFLFSGIPALPKPGAGA